MRINLTNLSPFLFLLLMSVSQNIFAQNASLQGKVTDSATDEALLGATVKVGNVGASTDADGKFSFSLAPGSYELNISAIRN